MVQIGVLTTYDPVPPEVEAKARALGSAIAKGGHVLITGGDGGLMRTVSEAAFKEGGTTVGIMAIEMEKIDDAHPWHNPFNSVVIRSGQSFTSRSSMVVRSSDALILLAGGVGSLTEVAMAYNMKKPIVVLVGTGMMADRLGELFPDGFLDHRRMVRLHFEVDPQGAVDLAAELARQRGLR
ncbi:MAG: TIGR00725 family protein [Candidatus Methanosuratincola sp.]